MKKILYTRPDGGLSIVHPVRNTYPKLEDLTEDEILSRALKDIPAEAIDVQIIDESQIPVDRTFRNAWKAGQGTIEHDMEKCREIHKSKLRDLRKPLLEKLDVDFMRALETSNDETIAEIKAKKQALRDITDHQELLNAQTPEELKQFFLKRIENATN